MKRIGILIALTWVAACSNPGGAQDASVCEPGETQTCVCSGGADGGQRCKGDGSGWEACECGSPEGDAGPGAADAGESDGHVSGDGGHGCPPDASKCDGGVLETCIDEDGDGYGRGEKRATCPACANGEPRGCEADCNDNNPDIHPGAVERCNGQDDNCNDTKDDIGVDACSGGDPCPVNSSPPQDGTQWTCKSVDGTEQCVMEGLFSGADECKSEQPSSWGICGQAAPGEWSEVPEQCK